MKLFMPVLVALVTFAHFGRAVAGVMEISYTFSQRSSFIDDDNFNKTLSHTGSFAWYFFEMSALELSYTQGEGEVSGKAASDTHPIKYITKLEMYDASLVFTMAQKNWAFQPYIKGGVAWVNKRIFRDDASMTGVPISRTDKDQPVPSFGIGFRFYLTKNISLRAGYDRWKNNNTDEKDIWDDAIRAGLSFTF